MQERDELINEIKKNRYSDVKKTEKLCRKLIAYAEQHEDEYAKAVGYLYLGQSEMQRGYLKDAKESLLLGIELQKKQKNGTLLMDSYNSLAIVYNIQQDTILSIEYFYKCLDLAKENGDIRMQSKIYNNIANSYIEFKDYEKAVVYLKLGENMDEADSTEEEIRYHRFLMHINLMTAYYFWGKYEHAYEQERMTELYIPENDEQRQKFSLQLTKTLILDKLGKKREARELSYEVINQMNQWANILESFDLLEEFAKYLMQEERDKECRDTLDLLAKFAVQTELTDMWMRVYSQMITYFKKNGKMKELLHAYMGYRYFSEQKEEEHRRQTVQAMDNRFELRKEQETCKKLLKESRKWESRSRIDEVTGVENRASLQSELESFFVQCSQKKQPIGLLLLDIDAFKEYNDTYGHLEGDECLKKVAHTIQKVICRETNSFVARYGGDEFFIAVMDKSKYYFEGLAIQIVQEVRKQKIRHESSSVGEYVSVSIGGVYRIPQVGEELLDYIESADCALYQVKEAGRDGYRIITTMQKKPLHKAKVDGLSNDIN